MTEQELQAIEARLAAATPGPWRGYGDKVFALLPSGVGFRDQVARVDEVGAGCQDANADLIGHAPSDIAALLAEVRRLQGEYERGVEDAANALGYNKYETLQAIGGEG